MGISIKCNLCGGVLDKKALKKAFITHFVTENDNNEMFEDGVEYSHSRCRQKEDPNIDINWKKGNYIF